MLEVHARLAVVAVAAVTLLAAGASWGAERPGAFETEIAGVAFSTDVQALGVLPDHRIVVAGTSFLGGPLHSFVSAYLPAGGPDAGFGDGGVMRFDPDNRQVGALAVEPDGQILLTRDGGTLHRLNSDGSPDTSFGAGGTVDLVGGSGQSYLLTSLALQRDGRIVVAAGPAVFEPPQPVQLTRYLPDGSPDPSFGTNGRVSLTMTDAAIYPSVAVQPDGRIVLAINAGQVGMRIARLTAAGSLDSTFGRGGVAPLELGRRHWLDDVNSAYGNDWQPLILRDGRIRIPITFGPRERVSRLGLVGLTANGHVDRGFGRRGLALGPRQDVPEGGEWPRVAVRDAHGGILVAGSTARWDPLGGEDSSIVRRFRRDGGLDLSFGRRGLVRSTFRGAGSSFEQQLAMLDRDTLVLAEEAVNYKYQSWQGGVVHTLNAGYDRDDPSIELVAGCRVIKVRITDLSGMDEVVVRANGRVIRRTSRKRLRVRLPKGTRRLSVRATDLAGNSSVRRLRRPRC
jgi:uncharacterized delta-60 repeat protein